MGSMSGRLRQGFAMVIVPKVCSQFSKMFGSCATAVFQLKRVIHIEKESYWNIFQEVDDIGHYFVFTFRSWV